MLWAQGSNACGLTGVVGAGFKRAPIDLPCSVSPIPRQIPPQVPTLPSNLLAFRSDLSRETQLMEPNWPLL